MSLPFENILASGTHEGFEWKVLHNNMGSRCGYILIPPEHPWFGKHYDSIDVSVHGGLTYANFGDNNTYWIGFDCAHYGDAVDPTLPGYEPLKGMIGTIRTQPYVEAECIALCIQAKQAKEAQ